MAIKEVKRYWESCQLDYVKEFLCHTEKDVEQLPACCVGSKAYVTETGNWYACGKDQTWKLEEEATEEGGTGGGAYIPTGGVSYTEGYRISASSGAVSENAATDLTDFIAVSIGDKVEMYGMVMPARTANVGVHFYAEDKTTKLLSVAGWDGASGFPGVDWEYTMQGDNVTMFVVPDWTEIQDVAYMRIVASDITDKSAIVVSHNEQGGGASLPDAAPYQQLVTDGDGKWVAEERLAWKTLQKGSELIPETNLSFTAQSGLMAGDAPLDTLLVAGEKYVVNWDGKEYVTTCQTASEGFPILGNYSLYNSALENTGEPFFAMQMFSLVFYTPDEASVHTVGLSAMSEAVHPIPDEYINKWDAIIHLDEGRWSDGLSAVRTEGMTLDEIWNALSAGKQPRICVHDHYYYGSEQLGVYAVLAAYQSGQAYMTFTFMVNSTFYRFCAGDNEDGNGFVPAELKEIGTLP